MKMFKIIFAAMAMFVFINTVSAEVKLSENFEVYKEDISLYVDINKCNVQSRNIYEVCWDDANSRASSGWAIIDPAYLNVGNIPKRPNFYQDKEVKTLAVSQYKLPLHKGHTFAKDEDYDYDKDILKLTYNLINITPMYSSVNIGIWRKIESRGRELALKVGPVLSITKVEYREESKFGIPAGKYPSKFTRIYIVDDLVECYESGNTAMEIGRLNAHQIECSKELLNK